MTYTCPCAHVCVRMCVRISDRELVSGIYKVLAQINRRNTDNPEKKWARRGRLRLRTAHAYKSVQLHKPPEKRESRSTWSRHSPPGRRGPVPATARPLPACPRQKHTLMRPTATRPLLGTARVPPEAAARRCAGAGDGVRDLTPAGAAHEGTKGASPSLWGTNQPALRTAGRQGRGSLRGVGLEDQGLRSGRTPVRAHPWGPPGQVRALLGRSTSRGSLKPLPANRSASRGFTGRAL